MSITIATIRVIIILIEIEKLIVIWTNIEHILRILRRIISEWLSTIIIREINIIIKNIGFFRNIFQRFITLTVQSHLFSLIWLILVFIAYNVAIFIIIVRRENLIWILNLCLYHIFIKILLILLLLLVKWLIIIIIIIFITVGRIENPWIEWITVWSCIGIWVMGRLVKCRISFNIDILRFSHIIFINIVIINLLEIFYRIHSFLNWLRKMVLLLLQFKTILVLL